LVLSCISGYQSGAKALHSTEARDYWGLDLLRTER
jgi:hypothetical protein